MFLEYYKLSEQPFGVTPDSRFLYLGPKHREALASLLYGTESNRGFLALIAKPGMGKTSLLYHYLEYLQDKARTAFVFRTDCDSREFIRHVMLDLGIDVSGMDVPAMHDALNRLLTEEMRAGRRFVLVIDEAQNLEEKVLESIRLLSNFETPWMKLMQIVLAGQPQLADRLARPSLAQLRQRVSMVIRIEPFTPEEVNAYIDHRLYIAGCSKASLFTAGARRLIADHSEGIPRNINNLCFNAMSLGCALKHKAIDREIVLEVISDLDLEPLREKMVAKAAVPAVAARVAPILLATKKTPTRLGSWISPKAAVLGALIATSAWAAVEVKQNKLREIELSASAGTRTPAQVAPTATSLDGAPPSTPVQATVAPFVAAPVQSSQIDSASSPTVPVQQSVNVEPGQTLYQISVANFGKYDGELLTAIRGLNPWLTNPDHIQPGQKIRMPATAANAVNEQKAEERLSSAPHAEAGKQ